MKKKFNAMLAMVLMGAGLARADGPEGKKFEVFEQQILKSVADGQYGDAIRESAAYELALENSYAGPVFAEGKLTSAAHGMTLNAPFASGWKADLEEMNAGELAGSGVEMVLAVQGDSDTDHLRMMTIDLGAMTRRLGFKDPVKEQAVIDTARGISDSLGHIEIESKTKVGEMTVVRTQIDSGNSNMEAAAFEHNGQLFYVLLTQAKEKSRDVISGRMDELLKTVAFLETPQETKARMTEIEAEIPGNAGLDVLLKTVGEYAVIGEYREASLHLLDARVAIASRLPKPVVTEEKVTFDAYKLALTNPNATKWKCDSIPVGAMQMMMLRDRENLDTGFVAVMVMDPVLTFGSVLAKDLSLDAPEDKRRNMLSRIGQGALTNIGRPIENESFEKFHGLMAYEGIVTASGTPNKMKLIAVVDARAVYMIMIMGAPEKMDAYVKAADQAVGIGDGK